MPQSDLHQDPNHPHNLNHLGDIVNRIRTILNDPEDEINAFTVQKEDLSSTDSLIEQHLQNLVHQTESLKSNPEGDSGPSDDSPMLRVFSEA